MLGNESTLAYHPWPTYDPDMVREEEIEMPVQVNGKLRSRIRVAAESAKEEIERAALQDERVQRHLAGRAIKKVIVVPGRLVNIVCG